MKHRWDRGAWLVLAIAAVLFVWGAAGTWYFFSLPTDGWLVTQTQGIDTGILIYTENVAGATSGLQPGDRVTAVEGIPSTATGLSVLSSRWRSGNTFHYTVMRSGTTLTVPVTLVRWSFATAVRFFVATNGEFSGLLGQLIFLVIAAFTFFKRPADHAARALFLLGVEMISVVALVSHSQANLTANIYPLAQFISIFAIVISFTILFPPTLLWLSLVFPHAGPVVQKHPLLEYAPFFIGLAVVPLFIFTNGGAGWIWTVFSVVATIAILIHSTITMRDALSRAQLFWGLWGMIVGLLLFLSSILINFGVVSGVIAEIINTLSNLGYDVLGISLSVAILRYHLYDIDFIIRRTMVYGVLTAILGLTYSGVIVLLQLVFHSFAGTGSDLAIVASTLVIAALFTPLRRRVQNLIDHRFFRRKYDAEKVLASFNVTARDQVDLNQLTDTFLDTVKDTLQPDRLSLWLRPPDVSARKTANENPERHLWIK